MARKHLVKCKYCGVTFDTNTVPFVKPSSTRYAHKTCYEQYTAQQEQEKTDKEELYSYIEKLFNGSYNYAAVNTKIKKYREEYNYTYSGIRKALVYFYEVKGHPVDKANGSIGIVPYVYKDAFNYYYTLWEAQQKNKDKAVVDYKPKDQIVRIPSPQRNLKKRKLFTFLDEEEVNGE